MDSAPARQHRLVIYDVLQAEPVCPRADQVTMDLLDQIEADLIARGNPLTIRRRQLREQGMSWLEILRATRPDVYRIFHHEELAHGVHDHVVYYMRMDGLVKIGTSKNIRSRIATLRPQGVWAVEHGSYDLEHRRQNQFAEDHSHGEWFHLSSALWDHIADLRSRRHMDGLLVDEWLALWAG